MNKSEFDLFATESSPSPQLEAPAAIVGDLVSSKFKLIMTYMGASALGYCASLLICAQCSIGFSSLSWQTMHLIHKIPDPWCAMVCGAIYGIFPFLASMIFLNRFQHRFLLFRLPWVPISVPLLGNIALTLTGAVHDLSWHVIWFISALSIPYLCEFLTGLSLKQKQLRT